MQKTKHYTIPVFTPEMACPFRCVFCNQQKISGHFKSPDFNEVTQTIRTYLNTFKAPNKQVEVGFFGGTFTGIPETIQEKYLETVQPFLQTGEIQGIRLSTRPDYIDKNILERLKRYGVTTIELGAQSLDDDVLKKSRRGHTAKQVEKAATQIKAAGFDLGLQMMIGLPGDTREKSLATADKIIAWGASNTRIYPTLVIKDTVLHHWYKEGKYQPLSLEEAVNWSKSLLIKFENAGVQVIRMGLHPSEGLLNGEEWIAGPFHPSFRELVLTEIWYDLLTKHFDSQDKSFTAKQLNLEVSPKEINYAIGYSGKNRKMLQSFFRTVRFYPNEKLDGREFRFRLA